jgi:hypothetical protein
MVLTVLKIAAFTFILRLILNWSYNLLFALARRPLTWVFLCLLVGFSWFAFSGGLMKFSINVSWWSAALALVLSIPPKRPPQVSEAEFRTLAQEMARGMGVAYSPAKYRLGLAAFAIGAIVGWITFYGSIEHV